MPRQWLESLRGHYIRSMIYLNAWPLIQVHLIKVSFKASRKFIAIVRTTFTFPSVEEKHVFAAASNDDDDRCCDDDIVDDFGIGQRFIDEEKQQQQ